MRGNLKLPRPLEDRDGLLDTTKRNRFYVHFRLADELLIDAEGREADCSQHLAPWLFELADAYASAVGIRVVTDEQFEVTDSSGRIVSVVRLADVLGRVQ